MFLSLVQEGVFDGGMREVSKEVMILNPFFLGLIWLVRFGMNYKSVWDYGCDFKWFMFKNILKWFFKKNSISKRYENIKLINF